MHTEIVIPIISLCCLASFFIGWYVNAKAGQSKVATAKELAKKVLEDAEKEADTLKREKLLEAKDEWYQKKKEFDSDVQSKRSKLQAQEKAIETREENIDRKVELLGKKEREQQLLKKSLDEQRRAQEAHQAELERLIHEENIR
ncbi:MAG TPA: Rnase Y domain-containing protein, partial [Bacteroidota bacterium]|nr:Rnase Y domain-containing protein [Bacteroidota bacterium]